MNSVLNIALRKLVQVLMANKWTRLLAVALAVGLAGMGSLTALKPDAAANTVAGHPPSSGGYTLAGRVVRVADGDTFTLLVDGKQQKVRMASIDAPETTKDSQRPGQAHAQASKDALAALISGKNLTVQCFERDRYDRNVCDVPLGNGVTANQQQVALGLAWANMEGRGKFMRDSKITALEQQAKQAKKGIWSQAGAVSPWAWRYQCWKQQQC